MKPLAIVICVVCQLFLVAGQLFLKHGMKRGAVDGWRRLTVRLAPGVACMTVWFFLWLGLLERLELSRVFPFEGLNPVLIVLGAWAVFRERMGAGAWVGIGLITAGVVLVSGS
ncbi:MAG TPA: EamA family transporter [Tepidisphaeraceae bacterium]